MADRFPLILNTSNNQIQEIASGDQLDLTGNNIANAGIVTAGNVTIGAATTDLVVTGDARITGILTIGTSSLTLDGTNNLVNVGTALTLGHTQGLQFHTQNLHSAGFEVNQVNASGIITATGADINGDIDVDGHTNLDNVSVSGVSTFAGNADFSAGIDVTGAITATGTITSNDITIQDQQPRLNFVDNAGSPNNPDYLIQVDGGNFVLHDSTNTADKIKVNTDGHIDIFPNTDFAAGIDVTGNATVSGNLSVGGVLTYEDVTNVDSVGLITARNGINVSSGTATFQGAIDANGDLDVDGHTNLDNVSIAGVTTASGSIIVAGGGGQLKLFHQSNVDKMESTSAGFHIRQINNGDLHIHAGANSGSANNRLVARAGGKAELYYAGNLKLSTETGGVNITGVCTATSFVGNLTGNVTGSQSGGSITATTGSFSGDATFNGGSGAISIGAGGDIRMSSGGWTGEYAGKIQHHNNFLYFQVGSTDNTSGWIFRDSAGSSTLDLRANGLIYGKNLTLAQKLTFNFGGAGAISIGAGGDIRMTDGNWTGEYAGKIQYHSNRMYLQGGTSGHQFRSPTGATTLEILPSGACSGENLSFSQDVIFNGADGAATIGANSDLRLTNGSWTGESTKIQHHDNWLYLQGGTSGFYFRHVDGTNRWKIDSNGHFDPTHSNTYSIGSTSYRVRDFFANQIYAYARPHSTSAQKAVALTVSSYTNAAEEGPFMIFNSKWSGGYDNWAVGAIGGIYETQSPGGNNAGAIVFHTPYSTDGQNGLSGTEERMRLRGDGQLRVFHRSNSVDINHAALRLIKTGGSTTDKTMISIENGNGDSGDLDYQSSNIDFSFFDTNTNVYPQVRIRANVGEASNNADSQVKEGRGWLSFHCSNTSNLSGEENPQEHFRIQHNGTLQGTDTSIGSLSDSRLKKNITDYSYSLDTFKQFKPKTFNWINPHLHGVHTNQRGFIAQDVESIDSYFTDNSIVDKEIDDYKLIPDGFAKTTKLVEKDAMYISVIQQLIEKVEKLETEVAALKGS